jgi:hypothetical protein
MGKKKNTTEIGLFRRAGIPARDIVPSVEPDTTILAAIM